MLIGTMLAPIQQAETSRFPSKRPTTSDPPRPGRADAGDGQLRIHEDVGDRIDGNEGAEGRGVRIAKDADTWCQRLSGARVTSS